MPDTLSLDLTLLSKADAGALAEIAEGACVHFKNMQDGARHVIAANGPGHWQEQHKSELARATRLRELADNLRAAADVRERQAGREECVAVRMVEALALKVAA